jgi:polysaccharide biosynthesis protein PslG
MSSQYHLRRSRSIIVALLISLFALPFTIVAIHQQQSLESRAAGTQLSFTVFMHGIGKGGDSANASAVGNTNPVSQERVISVGIFNPQNAMVTSKAFVVTYNATSGNFAGSADFGTLPNGSYTVTVRADKYLQRAVSGIQTITSGQSKQIPPVTLIAGDMLVDNKINIQDYNLLMNCYSDLTPAKICTEQQKFLTDITDDGSVNQLDYNLFIREISNRGGETNPTVSPVTTQNPSPTQPQPATSSRFGIAAGDRLPLLSSAGLNSYMDDAKVLGAAWIRFDFSWVDIQPTSASTYNWSKHDAIVQAANARGIKVLGTLAYPPKWALPSNCQNSYECPAANPAQFAEFSKAVVQRYASQGVHHWEIWNEPNLGKMTPAQYTPLLIASYTVIKSTDSSAIVLGGSLAPAATEGKDYSPVDFLKGMYANGAKGKFDALAHHPYCWGGGPTFDCPKTFAQWSAWSQMQETNPSLRSVMTQNGDQDKKIWGTEFGAPTAGGSVATPESKQAQVVKDAYTMWNSYNWTGPLLWYQYQDKCNNNSDTECFFGLKRYDGTPKPGYDAYKTISP